MTTPKQSWRIQGIHCAPAEAPVRQIARGRWKCGEHVARTPHAAIALWAQGFHIIGCEILAPGEPTREEAIAQAVRDERERLLKDFAAHCTCGAIETCAKKGRNK